MFMKYLRGWGQSRGQRCFYHERWRLPRAPGGGAAGGHLASSKGGGRLPAAPGGPAKGGPTTNLRTAAARARQCPSGERWRGIYKPIARRDRPSPENRQQESSRAANDSEEFLGERDDDARGASHVAESVLVLVLDHLADEFGADGAQASDSVVNAFHCEHDASQAQRVRRCDRRLDLDQCWIAKLRQLEPPVPVRRPHHDDVDPDTFEPVDAVHPRALDRLEGV